MEKKGVKQRILATDLRKERTMKRGKNFLMMLLCIPLGTEAQEAMSLDRAIEEACMASYSLQAAAHEIAVREEQRRASRGLRAPQLTLQGGYLLLDHDIAFDFQDQKRALQTRLMGLEHQLPDGLGAILSPLTAPLFQADWRLTLQRRQLALLGMQITLPIWMGGRIESAIRIADLAKESAIWQEHKTRGQLIRTLITRYYGVTVATRAVEVRRQALLALERHLIQAEKLEQNGVIAHSEVLYIAYKEAEARRNLTQAELTLTTLRSALASLIGGVEIQPTSPLFIWESPSPHHFIAAAEIHNPTLQEITLKVQEAQEGVKVKRATLMPEIVAMGSGTLCHYQASELLPRWAVGIGLSWRLFDGLQQERSLRAARHTSARVVSLRQEAQQQITLLIEESYNKVAAQRAEVEAFEASIHFAEAYLKSRRIAFEEGLIDATDLIDAEVEWEALQLQRMEAAYQYTLALCQLLEASGAIDRFVEISHCKEVHYIQ